MPDPAVRLGPRSAGPPVRTGWNDVPPAPAVTGLGDLADVALVEVTDEPTVLVRDPATGVFSNRRLSSLPAGGAAARGSTVHYLAEVEPDTVPAGAAVGDFIHVIAGPGAGTVYEVQEV